MRYPGGKNCAGTWQTIINQMPPHETFVELFAGSAAITRHKRPAARTILIDRDAQALEKLRLCLPPDTVISNGDAIEILGFSIDPERCGDPWGGGTLLYADPPYMHVRSRYRNDFTGVDHEQLLRRLAQAGDAGCCVMISGYRTALYNRMLAGWRRLDFSVITRGGRKAVESLWMNYPQPLVLHDPRFTGQNYRQRENLARKKRRWTARIAAMPTAERQLLLEALTAGLGDEERRALVANLVLRKENGGKENGVSIVDRFFPLRRVFCGRPARRGPAVRSSGQGRD